MDKMAGARTFGLRSALAPTLCIAITLLIAGPAFVTSTASQERIPEVIQKSGVEPFGVPTQEQRSAASALLGSQIPFNSTSSVALAAVATLGLLWASRRQSALRSRVVMGTTYGTWYKYEFRQKAGAKFRYRYSRDQPTPEWGVWPPERDGRVIKYGKLLYRGDLREQRGRPGEDTADSDEAAAVASFGLVDGALLLDCDGTIVETERDGHRVAFNEAFAQLGLDVVWDVELYGELLKTGGGKERITRYFSEINPGAWKEDGSPAEDHPVILDLHRRKTEIFTELVRSGALPLRDGIKDLVADAMKRGWQVAVCSTSNEESVKAVIQTALPEFASAIQIFAGDIVAAKKPDPAIYELACEQLGTAPMKCVVVEDTAIGLQAGKAAGMKVIVTKSIYSKDEDFAGADLVLDSAAGLDFETDVVTLLPVLEFA